ncbi:catalase [Pseudoroseomonas wenyumeiae]
MPHPGKQIPCPAPGRRRALASMLAGLLTPLAAARAEPETARQIVGAFDRLFEGPHEGLRAVHANGLLCEGSFLPAPGAAHLSHAAHFTGAATPVLARFSNFAAIPGLPDGHPPPARAAWRSSSCCRMAARPTSSRIPSTASPPPRPRPSCASCAACRMPRGSRPWRRPSRRCAASWIPQAATGQLCQRELFRRHRLRLCQCRRPAPPWPLPHPTAGRGRLADAGGGDGAGARLPGRGPAMPPGGRPGGPAPDAATGGPGDQTADGSQPWPEDRPLAGLGTLSLHRLAGAPDAARPDLRFVPTSLVAGIEPSDDPMLLARTLAYDVSAERRARP